ncbi:hypothetical protein KCP78_23175 [Salmonella enterica subsp. enterica]|nr:hypothetical protein KCP78_23175 [Salmonella enterica subsp. enterica]
MKPIPAVGSQAAELALRHMTAFGVTRCSLCGDATTIAGSDAEKAAEKFCLSVRSATGTY